FLVEQQQFAGTFIRQLTPYLDCSVSAYRIQNNEAAVLLLVDRRSYNNLAVGLSWHPAETWSLGALIQNARTQTLDFARQSVSQWRSSVTLTWSAYPTSRSW